VDHAISTGSAPRGRHNVCCVCFDRSQLRECQALSMRVPWSLYDMRLRDKSGEFTRAHTIMQVGSSSQAPVLNGVNLVAC
jgi:hypothetical protein